MTGPRREILLGGARLAAAAALGGLALVLGLRRRKKTATPAGYCDRAGRCGGCDATRSCEVYQATHREAGHGR